MNDVPWYSDLKLFLDSEELTASTNIRKVFQIIAQFHIKFTRIKENDFQKQLHPSFLNSKEEFNKRKSIKRVDIKKEEQFN
ncbi:hypothetical protein U3516DRAFT_748629 [Neocallimastix sp. 'constans']